MYVINVLGIILREKYVIYNSPLVMICRTAIIVIVYRRKLKVMIHVSGPKSKK